MATRTTSRRLQASQPQKRCWNCRDRKVACDRAIPSCNNCIKRGQKCQGYGLKLSWPRRDDVRRSAKAGKSVQVPIDAANLEYVHATPWDVELFNEYGDTGAHDEHTSSWEMYAPLYHRGLNTSTVGTLAQLDPFLDLDGQSPVALVISSVSDGRKDLYRLLIRMSLSDNTAPAIATRHALSSISYQHMYMSDAARYHQIQALSALQASINSLRPVAAIEAFQSMAASMLLNIYETMTTESSPLSWSVFFCGTKNIAKLIHQPNKTYDGDSALILDWIFYHDSMYAFSINHWVQRNADQASLQKEAKIISKAVFSPLRHHIIPSLGCSLELLDTLCKVIASVYPRDSPDHHLTQHLATLRTLELRLQRIEQHLPTVSDLEGPTWIDSEQRPQKIAELYRIATLLYLYRVARNLPRTHERVEPLLDTAFDILRGMGGCQRPWPMFIISLDARTDAERKMVMELMSENLVYKPLSNMRGVQRMVQAGWVQQDLREGDADPLFVYNAIVSANKLPPSFT